MDDGKRFDALDVLYARDSFIYKGGSLREGSARFARIRRVVDSSWGVFSDFFSLFF